MKNLSAILRLSLSETFTILITLVVCLAGFIVAEVNPEYRKQYSNQIKENLPYSHDTSKVTGDELEGRSYNKLKNFPESSLDLVKRQLANIGESDEYDQKENYGYDDDDYYHLNFKRSDTEDNNNNNDNNRKMEAEFGSNVKMKTDTNAKKFMNPAAKPNSNAFETIEMLNFKETHPPVGNENLASNDDSRKYNKKNPATPPLKMSDFRENSAIEEKIKENKEESTLDRGSSQSKLVETKKSEEKEPIKLKDSTTEDAEKKEKEVSLKDDKQTVAPKPIKETSDDKDKILKLSETSKLEENDKLVGKNKEAESKLKGGTEDAKVTSDIINPMDLSDKGNRASFVSSDYKDDSSKASAVEGEEKNSEESTGVESNIALSQQRPGEFQRNREMLRNIYSYNNMESNSAYTREIPIQMYQEPSKTASALNEYQNLNNDIFRKRDWTESMMRYRFNLQPSSMSEPSSAIDQLPVSSSQMSPQTQEFLKEQERALLQTDPLGQVPQEMNLDNRLKNPYGLNLPQNMLENTEYHKNFLKSLKRYKSMSNNQKNFPENNSGQIGSLNIPFSNTPEESETELKSDEKETPQNRHLRRREASNKGTSPQMCVPESQTSREISSDPTNTDRARTRRKSQKLEYEIKVINRSPHGEKAEELSHGSRRFEKDLKSKSTERYLKKYPYSQVSRDDLVNLGNLNTEKKTKRKAPIRKRDNQKSLIQPRAVPNGYYGNRVKFGQKNLAKNNERIENPDLTSFGQNAIPPPSLSNQMSTSAADKSKMLRSWEERQQEFKHETMKRFDSNGSPNKGNPLLLVRKSDRVATPFDEETPQSTKENGMSSGNLAKMLSSDNNYLVLSNPQNEQLQKVSDTNIPNNMVFTGYTYPAYNTDTTQLQELKKGTKQPLKNKVLFARSSHTDKDERKVSSGLHASKSNLKKTFEKFRDLAGFFKDNEQESSDNQYQAQELKEGRDIVFSEDKLPDPIVINSDGNEKFQRYTQKPMNSIYSISTNFKTLDQQDKKTDVPSGSDADKNMLTAESKPDNLDSNWAPALKNAFPEAKSINAMTKNGNEIIILDLNRNQLKTTHPTNNQMKSYTRPMQYGFMGYKGQMPTGVNSIGGATGERKIQVTLTPNSPHQQINPSAKKNFRVNPQMGKPYNMMQGMNSKSIPIEGLPALFRALMDTKAITKRSLTYEPSAATENYNRILKELNELSNINQKNIKKFKIDGKRKINDITFIPSGLHELSSYGSENVRSLENILQSIMAQGSTSNTYNPTEDNVQKLNPELEMAYKTWQVPDASLSSLFLGANKPKTNFFVGKTQEQNNLWDGFSPASGNRLRREETEKQKAPEIKSSVSSNDNMCQAIFSKTFPDPANTQSNEISDGDSQEKSEYENQLNEFFENLYKNQKEPLNLPNESTWKRKKRKEIHSEKRSAGSGNKNKVSTTAEASTIFKNLAEYNDQSVYSPGLKRRLFSTNNEADDADNNSDAIYEHDKDVLAKEVEQKCVKNSLNKYVDPMILEIFRNPQEKEKEKEETETETEEMEEKVRSRRSLSTGFHSNFKREIDLDESMPNDFQDFLVTSVGGFGSQTREALKKDDALWEGKANFQDGVSEPYEDSSLAKRDVSSMEKQKTSPYNKRFLPGGGNNQNQNLKNVINSLQQTGELKAQRQKLSRKSSEYREEKLPTQIRIQISNASAKEKKSSKPIMDESETTSTETENLPKEKEFLDKNKAGTVQEENTKLRNPTKNRYGFSDYDESEDSTPYKSSIRRKKKKKYVPENPSKPAGDFLAFDQKAMESLLRRIVNQQNMIPDQTTHRSPIASHLPQVETVYNPTQETNKAQLRPAQFRKMTVGDSNGVSAKTNLHALSRASLGGKDKLNSENRKDEGVSGWPNFNNFNQDSSQNSIWDTPNINLNPTIDTFENGAPSFLFPYNQKRYYHKSPLPSSNYFCHTSPDSSLNVENFYDALKLRQELKSKGEFSKQHRDALMARKNNENYMTVQNRAKSPDSILPYGTPWSNEYLSKSSIPPNIKNKFSRAFVRKGKAPVLESLQQENANNDYLDGFEDDYSEWLDPNEPLTKNNLESEGLPVTEPGGKIEKSPFEAQMYQNSYFKNPDADDEDEEETEEDYGENLEDEDADDFSVLANKDSITPEMLENHDRGNSYLGLLDGVAASDIMTPDIRNMKLWEKDYEASQMNSPRTEAKLIPESPEEDVKPDLGLSSSSSLLRDANRKSNILKNNLIRNTYGIDADRLDDFEKSWRIPVRNFARQRKAFRHRRRDYPKIGNKVFYVTKSQFRNADPDIDFSRKQGRQSYRQNPLNVAFADPDNNFENESEEDGKRFSDSFLNLGKNSQEDGNFGNENMELDDVTENLEDAGKTISEDNVLENVIGKYIVRKRVASPADLSRVHETPLRKESENKRREEEEKHKITKRALGKFDESAPVTRLLTKRLSSGHLTESNFRKYHKKNLNKIQAEVTDSASLEIPKVETPVLKKRSALDIFKKITNKDHDSKKVESSDCRSAGFEPLSSLSDKKYETPNSETLSQLKKLISTDNQQQCNSVQFKPSYPVGVSSGVDQKRKEKIQSTEAPGVSMQGPWKVELINNLDKKKLEKPSRISETSAKLNNHNTIFVFTSGVIAPEQNAEEELPSVSGSFQKEVGNSYGPKYDEVRGSSKRHFRKRSLDSSLSSTTHEDAAQRGRFAKSAVTLEEKNRALHDKRDLSAGDSIPESTDVVQRSAKKIRSFVNTDDKCQNAGFPSVGSLNKRKSVFPPSDNANILRDNGHINEETSKYLGQQIVDAIWSHVSENPKLKELIAPALAVRMTANKEDVGIRQKPMEHQQQQQDISDQLQYFLQKFMNDLERLAEKHVKKRMCNKIDAQSKQFLQTLVSASLNPPPTHQFSKEKIRQCPDNFDKIWSGYTHDQVSSGQEDYAENLSKKHSLLTKLIDDYRMLSNSEKESLGVNYDKLLKELRNVRSEMSQMDVPWSASDQESTESDCEPSSSTPMWCPVCKPIPKKPPPKGSSSGYLGETTNSFPSEKRVNRNLRKISGLFFDEAIMKHARKQGGKINHCNIHQNKQKQQVFQDTPQMPPSCPQYMPVMPATPQVTQEMGQTTQKASPATQQLPVVQEVFQKLPVQEVVSATPGCPSQRMLPVSQQMSQAAQKMSPYSQQMTEAAQKMSPYSQQMSQGAQQMSPYSQQMSQGAQQMSPYSQQMSQGAQQMSPYSQQMSEAAQKMPPYSQQMRPDNPQMSPYSQQMSDAAQKMSSYSQQMSQGAQQMSPYSQQMSQGAQQMSPYSQKMPQGAQQMSEAAQKMPPYSQQMRPDNPQMSPVTQNMLPTYIFEEDPSHKSEISQRKEYSPFEDVEPTKFPTYNKDEDKTQYQKEGVFDEQNQKLQQESYYWQSQQPIKDTFSMQPTPESFDLLPFQNFSEKILNLKQTETSKSSDESQSQNTDTTTNSDTDLSNLHESSELKKVGHAAGLQVSINSKTLSGMPNSKLSSEGEVKGEESPNKVTASLKKARSTEDLQFHFGKAAFGLAPPGHLKPKFDVNGKKRIFLRSNDDPFRFQKDQTLVTDAGIPSTTSDQEMRESPDTADTDDSELEYLPWSAVPAVRRQLNNLETGFEFDEFFSKIPKLKKA